MAIRKKTIGIDFPFKESREGDYLKLTENPNNEVKANLIHLLTTRKGERFMLPEFGTNLHQYLFEFLDESTKSDVETEIEDATNTFMPNLKIENISVENISENERGPESKFGVTVHIDYQVKSTTFNFRDSVTLPF